MHCQGYRYRRRVSERSGYAEAENVLSRHGYETTPLGLIGAGEQSVCYGTEEVAVLLGRPGSTIDRYAVLQWLTNKAADAGVRTPRIVAVGEQPGPYAVMRRAHGTVASAHPDVAWKAPSWFGQLGKEVRKTHLVETTGFGTFVSDGSSGYRGRFASWSDYLDAWLGVHLCVGESRPEDEKVLDLCSPSAS